MKCCSSFWCFSVFIISLVSPLLLLLLSLINFPVAHLFSFLPPSPSWRVDLKSLNSQIVIINIKYIALITESFLNMVDPIQSLPYEIFTNILSYLSPQELIKCTLTSSVWSDVSSSNYVCTTL